MFRSGSAQNLILFTGLMSLILCTFTSYLLDLTVIVCFSSVTYSIVNFIPYRSFGNVMKLNLEYDK